MSVRRRGEAKQANGSANGSIKHEDVNDLKTDHTRWRMKNVDGRQTWHYLESDEQLKAWPMTSADKYYLGQDTVCQQETLSARCLYSNNLTRARKHFQRPQLLFKQLKMD